MVCPHLEYRRTDDELELDHERPTCAITDSFVSPVQADVCNDRFDFDHADMCDIYLEYQEARAGKPETAPDQR